MSGARCHLHRAAKPAWPGALSSQSTGSQNNSECFLFWVSAWGEVVITQNIAETQSLQFMMADIRRCLKKQEGLRQQKTSLGGGQWGLDTRKDRHSSAEEAGGGAHAGGRREQAPCHCGLCKQRLRAPAGWTRGSPAAQNAGEFNLEGKYLWPLPLVPRLKVQVWEWVRLAA